MHAAGRENLVCKMIHLGPVCPVGPEGRPGSGGDHCDGGGGDDGGDDGKSTKNLCEIDARLSALWSGPVYKV